MTAPVGFYTFNRLSRITGTPPTTLSRRIRELGIMPDGIAVEAARASVFLFRIDRVAEIRRALAGNKSGVVS